MAAKFDYSRIEGVQGNANVTPEFIGAVEQMAERLGTQPEYILAAMSFETGGRFDPSIQNGIGATGLIQFLKSTAQGLGTTTDKLAKMSAVAQLAFVEKYFDAVQGQARHARSRLHLDPLWRAEEARSGALQGRNARL